MVAVQRVMVSQGGQGSRVATLALPKTSTPLLPSMSRPSQMLDLREEDNKSHPTKHRGPQVV